jgi:hypothetical protein
MGPKLYRRVGAMIAKIIGQSADLYVYICTHTVTVLRTSTVKLTHDERRMIPVDNL